MTSNDPPLVLSAGTNLLSLRSLLGDSFDLVIRELSVAGTKSYAVCFDGLCDERKVTEAAIKPLTDGGLKKPSGSLAEAVSERLYKGTDCKILHTVAEAAQAALNGCLDIPGKRKEVAARTEETLAPDFWNDPKAAEAFLKKLAGVKSWVTD